MLVYLILATCLWGLTGILGVCAAIMSPMMFDAPNSRDLRPLKVVFWAVLTYPVVCAAAIAGGWVLHAYGLPSGAAVVISLPVVSWCVAVPAARMLPR